jgi:hypothetical protein
VSHKLVMTRQVRDWLHALRSGDPVTRRLVAEAIDLLLDDGPALGRPLADRVSGSRLHNLKELRPGSSGTTEVRILFIFDPARSAVLLVGGTSPAGGNSGTGTRSRQPRRPTRHT